MQPPLEYKIYQLDYSRKLGEYRMLEQFLPQQTTTHRLKNAPSSSSSAAPPTAAWPHGVGVQRTAWNDGNGRAKSKKQKPLKKGKTHGDKIIRSLEQKREGST